MTPRAIPRTRMRWRLRTLMIVVAFCAAGLFIYRVNVERAPVYRLIRQLRTGNAQARVQAAIRIGQMGPRASFADRALTSALDDPDPGVRTQAAYALVEVGGRSRRGAPRPGRGDREPPQKAIGPEFRRLAR